MFYDLSFSLSFSPIIRNKKIKTTKTKNKIRNDIYLVSEQHTISCNIYLLGVIQMDPQIFYYSL